MLTADQLKEHILNRVGYGLSRWHSGRYDELGPRAYIAQQLGQRLPGLALGPGDAHINTKLARSVLARRQLEAVLLDFWFNHFNVSAGNDNPRLRNIGPGAYIDSYQNDDIAPQLFGSFGAMLLATAKAPSMLISLNNEQNRRPAVLSDGRVVGYNENYAREVMELHTIGVDGGYTEQDVREASRILTGWGRDRDSFVYRSNRHDTDAKTIMAIEYPAGGEIEEGEAFLAFLAAHPSAARFLSRKLCVRFLGDNPPAAAVDATAAQYATSGGDLGATTAAILEHPAFVDPADDYFRSKVKPPHRFVASALMAMGAADTSDWSTIDAELVGRIVEAGDTPYLFPRPTGYPEDARYWLAPSSMLARFEIAQLIAYEPRLVQLLRIRSGIDGSDVGATFDAVQRQLLPGGVTPSTEAAVKDHAAANAVTNNQRLSAVAHMLLASPEFLRY